MKLAGTHPKKNEKFGLSQLHQIKMLVLIFMQNQLTKE
jgi:hypothetical protein